MADHATVNTSPTPLEAGINPGIQRATIIPAAVATHGQVLAGAALSSLALGNNHLTFHNWRTSGGPMAFPLTGNLDGSNLTGMGPDTEAAPSIDYTIILAGALVALVNTLAADITTSKNSSASPVGQRFADVYTIPGLSASLFIAADVGGGVIQWFQVKNA